RSDAARPPGIHPFVPDATLTNPPPTDDSFPEAVLLLPPATVESTPEAVLFMPPERVDVTPDATCVLEILASDISTAPAPGVLPPPAEPSCKFAITAPVAPKPFLNTLPVGVWLEPLPRLYDHVNSSPDWLKISISEPTFVDDPSFTL